jgi:hypothetical protein
MEQQMRQRLKAMLLERPGLAVGALATELGLRPDVVARVARELGLGTQTQRLIASGRAIKAYDTYRVSVYGQVKVFAPGVMIHFDGALLGRLEPLGQQDPRHLIVYSAVDRATGYCWSMLADSFCEDAASAAVRRFAADSPFPWAGAQVVVDGRPDVDSVEFASACLDVGARRRTLVGREPWSNGHVEQHHRVLKLSGLASLPHGELRTIDAVSDWLDGFVSRLRCDRRSIFHQTHHHSPTMLVAELMGRRGRDSLEVAQRLGLLRGISIERAIPLLVSSDGANLFRAAAATVADACAGGVPFVGLRDPAPGARRMHHGRARERPAKLGPGIYIYC